MIRCEPNLTTEMSINMKATRILKSFDEMSHEHMAELINPERQDTAVSMSLKESTHSNDAQGHLPSDDRAITPVQRYRNWGINE